MKNPLGNVKGFVGWLLVVLFFGISSVRAETIAATPVQGAPVTPTKWVCPYNGSVCTGTYTTALAAAAVECKYSNAGTTCVAARLSIVGTHTVSAGAMKWQYLSTTGTVQGQGAVSPVCPAGSTGDATNGGCKATSTTYTCPQNQNWTLSGQNCTRPDCSDTEERDANGLCQPKACPQGMINEGGTCLPDCASAAQTGTPVNVGTVTLGIGSTPPPYACLGGCQMVPSIAGMTGGGGFTGIPLTGTQSKTYYASGSFVANGQRCQTSSQSQTSPGGGLPSADPVPLDPGSAAAKCVGAGQGFGTVNGVVVCNGVQGTVTGVTGSSSTGSSSTTTTTNGPNGPVVTTVGDNTTSSTQTNCDGTDCTTTTTTTTTDPSTGDSKTATTSGTMTQAAYCATNPKAKQCAGTGDDPNGSDFELGTPTEEGAITSKAFGVSSITPVNLTTNDSCPADIPLPYGSISWEPICQVAWWFKPLILTFAWLSAIAIVVGGTKEA